MLTYIARRAVYTLVVLFVASIVIFWGLRIAPGDPANTLFNPLASEEAKNALREKFGLDEPIVVRLDGTNAEEGRAILEPHLSDRLVMAPTMVEAARKAVELSGVAS